MSLPLKPLCFSFVPHLPNITSTSYSPLRIGLCYLPCHILGLPSDHASLSLHTPLSITTAEREQGAAHLQKLLTRKERNGKMGWLKCNRPTRKKPNKTLRDTIKRGRSKPRL